MSTKNADRDTEAIPDSLARTAMEYFETYWPMSKSDRYTTVVAVLTAVLAWRDENGKPWLVTNAEVLRALEMQEEQYHRAERAEAALVDRDRQIADLRSQLSARDASDFTDGRVAQDADGRYREAAEAQIEALTAERDELERSWERVHRVGQVWVDRGHAAEDQVVALREALRDMLDEVAVSNQDPGPFDGPSRGCVDRARALLATGEQP